ncbi:hypothetical protein D3C73_1584150 [compost metagenome]
MVRSDAAFGQTYLRYEEPNHINDQESEDGTIFLPCVAVQVHLDSAQETSEVRIAEEL